ncbi:hypothetical protein UlMin_034295 [Ulmus minor]
MPSPYFSRLRTAVQRSIVRQEGGIRQSVEDIQALLRPSTIVAASFESQLVNRRKKLSVVGAISRTFSVPSVSGPSFQACGYHIDCALLDPTQLSISSKFQNKPMAAVGSRVLIGEYYSSNLTARYQQRLPSTDCLNISSSNKDRGFVRCQNFRMSLKRRKQPGIYGYLTYRFGQRLFISSPIDVPGSRKFHNSSSKSLSAGTARDVSFDNSSGEEQASSSSDSADQKITSGKVLKLVSASCYLPHPDKEATGGEDAHFICVDEQAVGVADGVGGWADLGVDSGLYSRELMSNSVTAIKEEPKGLVDPARVLEKAHSSTKAKGSSTACIIALTEQGIHAYNLGDSGFIVVRDGCTVFRSPAQQHDFNFTYQLESGNRGDLPSSGQVFTVPVAPGDVLIAGTDGLFDNLYNNEITAVVVHAMRAGFGPQATAQKIAALARQRAQDKNRQTPFATAAQDAGYRYYGGKLDDITVVVSYVRSSSEN